MKNNDKKQRAVAEKLGISTATLTDILRKDHLPSLKVAFRIEFYTKGLVSVYDWFDCQAEQQKMSANAASIPKPEKNKK